MISISEAILNSLSSRSELSRLKYAAYYGFLTILQRHMDTAIMNPIVDTANWTAFHVAAFNGHINIVEFYTDKLDDVNPGYKSLDILRGQTPLHLAAQRGHFDIVEHITKLLENKNPADDYGVTPLHSAAVSGHLDIVKYLIELVDEKNPKAGLEGDDRTPIHDAAVGGHVDVIEYLLQYNQNDINPISRGQTVLHIAAQYGHKNVFLFYKDKLANLNPGKVSKDQFSGRTPLHDAAQRGEMDIIEYLIPLIDDPNPEDDNGITPLHLAAANGHLSVVQYIIPLVNDKNPKDGEYWGELTALHRAALRGHLEVVKYLAPIVPSIDVKSLNNKTPLEYARANGHNEIVQFLENF